MNEEAIKDAYGLFTNTGYNGSYEDFKQLIQSNSEARADAYGLFTSTGYNGSQQDFDQLMGVGGPVPVKKKEEPTVLPWNQKPAQPKPKPEPALPFLESKPSGISLGSQRVPEAPPMFEAPPMRTPEQVKAIVEAPEKAAETADSEQGWLLNTVSALDRGFYKNLVGNPIKGMGTLLEGATGKVFGGTGKGPISDALISFGDYFNKAIDELAPQDEAYKNSLSDQFGQAFGQVASLVLTGGVAGAGKEGVALAATPQGAVGVVKEAGKKLATDLASPTAISAGLSMGQSEFDKAKELGATDDQAFEVFYKNAAVGSILEQIPVMQFLKRFNQSTAGGVANYIKTKGVAGLTGGFEEMTTEVLQQLYANKSAQDIYNINQSILEGVGESGGVGFGVGFLLNAMGARAKVLRKEGKPQEAQLIENQIAEFENKPTTPPASYSINGIKVDSPKVIDDMIETMDVENLTKANIEITNDPVLSDKLQDKMVTSSIKEEVREANPNLDEQTLDQITALEKERRKFEGKKTQTAKDKLSSINSQIKTLQENAVQKPSTEEGVLRPEEPQVGLQEVGEGDAKEQAPAEEVVKEEVAIYIPTEDQNKIIEETVGNAQNGTLNTRWADWFLGESKEAKSYISDDISKNKKLQDAMKSKLYDEWKKVNNSDISFEDFLNSEIELFRGGVEGDRNEVDVDGFNSWELTEEGAKKFSKGNPVRKVKKKVKDLYGLVDIVGGELEVLEPTQLSEDYAKRVFNSQEMTDKMFDNLSRDEQKKITELSKNNKYNEALNLANDLLKNKTEVVKEEVVTPEKDLTAALERIEIPEDTETLPGIDDELKQPEVAPVVEPAPKVSSKTPKAKAPKAKGVPIPVAIPKPAPEPTPAPEQQPTKEKVPSESFLDVTDKEFPNDHILGGYAVTDEDGGLIGRISLEQFDDNTVKINEVVSEKRGQKTGNGRKIMEKITKLADENGISLTLVPNIIGEMKAKGFETPQKLKDFYKKFGFVVEPNTGRMTRKPAPTSKTLKELEDEMSEVQKRFNAAKKKMAKYVTPPFSEDDKARVEYNNIVEEKNALEKQIEKVKQLTPAPAPTVVKAQPFKLSDSLKENVKSILKNAIDSFKKSSKTVKEEISNPYELKVYIPSDTQGLDSDMIFNFKGISNLENAINDIVNKFPNLVGISLQVYDPNTEGVTKETPLYYNESSPLEIRNELKKLIEPTPKPTPAPAPAPAPTAVVSQPTTKAVGPEALRQEYINKIAEVRLNQDKSRTPKQIDERVKELQAEYNKLKAEMTAPKPKAAPAPKAAPDPKVEAKEVPKSKFQQAQDFADKLSAMTEEERDDVEFDENYRGYQLFEARKVMPKTPNTTKFKKVDENNSSTLYSDYEYIANIDGEPYGLVKYEDPDDPDNDKAFVWAYEKVGTDNLFETITDDNEELISEIKSQISKEKKTTPTPTPVSVVEEEEPSYDEIKDLDPTDETVLKKVLKKLDSMDNGLGEFGRGNLSSGIAIPLARAIIKSIKVLVKAGITVEEAIKRIASENNLEANAVKKMIIDIDKAQTALKKLKDQIKAEVRVATDVKNDMNKKRKNLSKVINDMEVSGKISAFKAKAVINRINKLNLDSSVAVDRFIDYVDKVFYDAEYLDKLNTAKETRSRIRKLSKSKDKFANLRELGSKFIEIDPSMVDNIDEYNKIATLIKDSIKGSTTRGADVKLANIMKESDAMDYINKTMDAQREMILNEKANEVQDLLGIDASDLTYEQLVELVDSDKPLTKYNEGLIRAAINKAFDVYSSMINASIRNGKDVFTDEDVEYSANQKRVVKEFMSMDLNVLKPKQALEAVDALVNFLQNQSIAKMESVVAKYKGETAMREIEKKGIKAKPIRKYWSKGLGRLLIEQTANLPIVFERMFGGFTRGGMVEDAMGITALKNGKSKAQSQSNAVVDNYVKELYNSKPNNEAFNTAENDIERGMTAFMMRNIVGTEAEMQSEFNRRKKLIEESIKVLAEGNELEVKKGKIYEKVYNKILKDSKNIDDVVSKSSEENNKGVKLWQSTWADKYPELYDVALGVYNKVLGRDVNFTPDRFAKLSSDPGEVDLTSEDMGFLVNSGTAPLYKKETGVLMAATRPESLPRNPNTQKPNRYVDLSFDRNNANSYYDALVDINTAAPIRQVQSALNSDSFATIMKGTGDERLLRNRIDLFVRNIRNKNPFSNDEFSKAVKNLNRLASVGVGQALGGVLQPVKQVAPIAMNTLINAGGLDIPSVFDLSKQEFINNSGYAIANRGIESQAQIESLNKMIEEAASSKPEQAIKAIEKINNWWLKSFLVKPDVYIARASWMTYYEQSLKKQGIDPATIDYSTHEINEEAANYAQRQVDRQQNISDSDLAGALLSDKDASKQLFVKVLMPFASFRMNQSARLGSDLATLTDKTSTKEDKKIAVRSLGGFAVEMAVFRIVSAASALLIAELVKGIMDRDDDEEKDKKKNDAIIKGQLTSTVADVFSPTPLLDKGVQIGASAILDATQDALDVNEEDRLDIYSGNKQDFFQSLGLLGISGARASQLYEMSKLAAGGSYEDNYGRKKYLSEKDRDAIATLIPIAIVSNTGLAPSEVNSIVRSSLADAKRSGSTVGGEGKSKSEESKAIELNKTDLKRYYPDIYEQYYGEGTEEAERRKLKQEQNKLEREIKDEYYDYKSEPNKKSSKTKTNTNISGFGGKGFAD